MEKLKKLLEAGKIEQADYDALIAEYNKITGQRDDARKESGARRIKLSEQNVKLESLEEFAVTMSDKFAIDLKEDGGFDKLRNTASRFNIDEKVDVSKLNELEAKFKRADKESIENKNLFEKEQVLRLGQLKQNEILKAISPYKTIDDESAAMHLETRTIVEDGVVKYRDRDGVLLPLEDGVKAFFNDVKPNLLASYGQENQGSGFNSNGISALIDSGNMNAKDILATRNKR